MKLGNCTTMSMTSTMMPRRQIPFIWSTTKRTPISWGSLNHSLSTSVIWTRTLSPSDWTDHYPFRCGNSCSNLCRVYFNASDCFQLFTWIKSSHLIIPRNGSDPSPNLEPVRMVILKNNKYTAKQRKLKNSQLIATLLSIIFEELISITTWSLISELLKSIE